MQDFFSPDHDLERPIVVLSRIGLKRHRKDDEAEITKFTVEKADGST
jgi:hypothetical protein